MKKKLVLSVLIMVVLYLTVSAGALAGGKTFLGGGAIADSNADIWKALYQAAGGGTPRIAVICSGSPGLIDAQDGFYIDTVDYWSWQHLFQYYGFDPVFIPIAIDNCQTAAYDSANINLVNSCIAVWFNGGDQSRHARCLLQNNGTDTPLMTAIRSVYNRGGVVAGSSAGAAIMGEFTYGEGVSYGYMKANNMAEKLISDMSLVDPTNADNGGYMTGFGFLTGIDACIDTHVGGRGRIGRVIVAMRELSNPIGIGMDENSAMIIENGIGKVYGQYGAFIIDGRTAYYPRETYFGASGLTIHSLSRGDSIDFTTMTVTSTKPLITKPYYSSVYNSTDIFKTEEAFSVMERLVDSTGTTATGDSFEKRPRFTLTFTKNGTTKGYYGDGVYTVVGLDLSVTWSMR